MHEERAGTKRDCRYIYRAMLSFDDIGLELTMTAATKLPIEARSPFMVDCARMLIDSRDPQATVDGLLRAHLALAMATACPAGDHCGDSALAGPPHRATRAMPVPRRRIGGQR